jgi:ferredoxin
VSLTIDADRCIGCGACDYGCPTGAIQAPGIADGPAFWIQTYRCNDCGWCPTACPVDAIVVDPDTIVCEGRGCPLAQPRYEGWTCSLQVGLCACGDPLWTTPEGVTGCARCDLGLQVGCPKTLWLRKGRTEQRPPKRPLAELHALRT